MEPENKEIITQLAFIQFYKGNYTGAEIGFNKAFELSNKTYSCPYEGLGILYYHLGNYKEAKQILQKSIEISPDREFVKYNLLAKIYIQEGKIEEARKLLEKSIINQPEDNEAFAILENLNLKGK